MSEESGAPDRFRTSLRGYDRDQVDATIAELEERVATLERERGALAAALGEEGDDDLGSQIDAVSAEIGRILHAAHEAAENMRSRAAEDASSWRAEAEEEAQRLTTNAREAAEAVRADVWSTGSELLAQSKAEAAAIAHRAEQEGLATRADAEREASRHVAAVRKDLEEQSRQARVEADRALDEARREAEAIVTQATLEAEAAQERARALEERRASLMAELETAQGAISKLEADLEERKEALRIAGGDTASVRVLTPEPEPEPASQWFDEEETVRVVAPGQLSEPEPVDPDAFVAEVEQMRQARAQPPRQPRRPSTRPVQPQPVAVEPVSGEPSVEEVQPEPVASEQPEPEQESVMVQPETEPEPEQEPMMVPPKPEPEQEPVAAEQEPVMVEPEPVAAEPEPAPEPVAAVPAADLNEIDALFAKLRGDVPVAPSTNGGGTTAPGTVAVATEAAATGTAVIDPLDIRERLLLPITNRALREVKRNLLELQNVALEELRTSAGSWRPDREAFEGVFRDQLVAMAHEAMVAGFSGAAQMTGASHTPHAESVEPADPTPEVAGSLWREVDEVAERSIAAEAGERQTAAAVSRVFRTWRSDGAERWMRAASYASYHEGVLWGLASLGITEVAGYPAGRLCAECPAARAGATWHPTGEVPEGTGIPPVHVDCACTITPA